MTRQEIRQVIIDYRQKYTDMTEQKYPKLSTAQKKVMTQILIADSLTAEQMENDEIYKNFSVGGAQKVENDLILLQTSNATLRALEKKGLIEVIKLAGSGVDRIKLIKND